MPDLSYRMLHIAGAPAGLLGLTELFEEARYSSHVLKDSERKRAIRDLEKVKKDVGVEEG